MPEEQNSVADQQQSPETAEQSSPALSADELFATKLAEIKAPDGRQKYSDVATALDSLSHAQNHIKSLEEKIAALNSELEKRSSVEEIVESMRQSKKPEVTPSQPQGLSEDKLAELLDAKLQERERQAMARANEAKFSKEIQALYGDKAQEVIKRKAEELGIGLEFLRALAQKSPQAALVHFAVQGSDKATPTTPGVNTTALGRKEASDTNKALEEARAKLFGQRNSTIEKWRATAPN